MSSVVTVRPDAMPGFLLASPITRATDKKNLQGMFDQLSAQGDTIGDLASYSTDLLHIYSYKHSRCPSGSKASMPAPQQATRPPFDSSS